MALELRAAPFAGVIPERGEVLAVAVVSQNLPYRLVGRYLMLEPFAAGGMATVSLGRLVGEGGFSRTVAIKRLFPQFAQDHDFVAMFLDEARILSRIRHHHVVAPLDVLVLDSELFIVMEYVHGMALSQLCQAQNAPIPPSIASAIMIQVLLGLHAVHEATGENGEALNIIHRDISPPNVLVDEEGIARIIDFGIAKAGWRTQMTAVGHLKGKLGYMAPEYIRQGPTDRRVDVYTSGIVLWELLTGRRLFPALDPAAVFHAILSGDIAPPSAHVPGLPAALDAIALRALAPNPSQRFESAREMAAALERAVPPAGALEVGTWVGQLVGQDLRNRAARIAQLESVQLGQLELAPRTSSPDSYAPQRNSFPPLETQTTLRPPSTTPSDQPLVSSTDAAARPPRRRRVWFAVLAVVAGSTLGIWLGLRAWPALTLSKAQGQPRVGAIRIGSTLPAAEPERRSNRSGTPSAAAPSAAPDSSPTASSASKQPQPKTRPITAPPSVLPGAPSKAKAPKASRPNPCAVPYTVDAKGVKRFKPECF